MPSDPCATADGIQLRNHPWNLTVRLNRVPTCPQCAEPLNSLGVTIVCGMAFCAPCARTFPYQCARAAQFSHVPEVARHCSLANGLNFYTPRTETVMAIHALACEMNLEHLWGVFPLTATGEHVYLEDDYPPGPRRTPDPSDGRQRVTTPRAPITDRHWKTTPNH